MGRAARVNVAIRADQAMRSVYWYTCVVCRLEFPSQFAPQPDLTHLDVCPRCCVADIAYLMRTLPGTVAMLPTVRALQGKAQVVLCEPTEML